MTCIHHVAGAVQAVRKYRQQEAQKRVPDDLKSHSFFGSMDFWRYIPVFDNRLCPKCKALFEHHFFQGSHLRIVFPYLEIRDEDTINANVHPNCRCELWRVTVGKYYDKAYTKFFGDPEKV